MHRIVIYNSVVYTLAEVLNPGWLVVEQGKIVALGAGAVPEALLQDAQVIDARGAVLLPGFIDMHLHGALGYSVMDGDVASLAAIGSYLATQGVTGWLGSLMSASAEKIDALLAAYSAAKHNLHTQVQERVPAGGAGAEPPAASLAPLLGLHLEGPYLNKVVAGAQDPVVLRDPDPREYERWFATGLVRQVTVAPELPGAERLIRAAGAAGILVAVGHSVASYEVTQLAVAAGARQATHMWNAMAPLHHRNPGILGAILEDERVLCELIPDMVHVHPAIIRLSLAAKGYDGIVLVTDAERCAGLPEGRYMLDGADVVVGPDAVRLASGPLAGSTLSMARALRLVVERCGVPLERAWRMTSRNPARQLGLGSRKGELAVGYDADMVLLSTDLSDVVLTIAEGRIIFRNSSWRF